MHGWRMLPIGFTLERHVDEKAFENQGLQVRYTLAFPGRWRLEHHDAMHPNVVDAHKCRCRVN